jgi:hypothetical protein
MLPSLRFAGRARNPVLAGRSPLAYCTRRSIHADGHKSLPAYGTPERQPRRPRRFAPYRIARFILIARALIATVAIAFLVLGLLNVHAVTNHFRIH